jgi:hypothetical protein
LVAKAWDIRIDMQWIADHWFELATIALLAVIAINTLDSRWNNATIVEQLNDIIRRFSWLARRNAESRRNSSL